MLKKFFKRKFTDENFLEMLLGEHQNYDWLKKALNSKEVNIDHQDNNENTFLLLCLKKRKYKNALWLLDQGADPVIKNKELKNAMDIAIEKDKEDIVKRLLKHKKININQKDDYGRSLLQNLVISGNLSMAQTLIEAGADINNLDNRQRHIVHDALSYGDHTFVRYLLSLENIELNAMDEEGNTLMQHPQIEQNDILAKELMISGCDPTKLNTKGESYLYKTALRGKEAENIIDVALAYEANVNEKTLSGNTIMMELVLRASELTDDADLSLRKSLLRDVAEMVQHGGDINAKDSNGETGLFNAIAIRDIELINFLLENGIDPNLQNPHGETVLEKLVYDAMEYVDIIKLLLVYGIDPKIKNKDGECTFEILNNIILHIDGSVSIKNKDLVALIDPDGLYMEVVNLLLQNEIEGKEDQEEYILNILDSHGNPLFFKPLMYNNFALFSLYIKNGVNIHMLNSQRYNIFFTYVVWIFERNNDSPNVCKNFRDNLSSLVSRKVDKDFKDSLGWTVLHKVTSTECNLTLFNILVSTVKFNYSITDNLGRTVIHNCVWHDKAAIIKLVHKVSPKTLNSEDIYKIPAIYYAALLGNKKLVSLFFDLGATITNSGQIDPRAIKKFKPMLKNLQKLQENVDDEVELNKYKTIADMIEKKFI
jgi:ankyrin repeat protein